MLDKKITIGIGALLLLSSMIMLSGNVSATTFTLNSWEIIIHKGYTSLYLNFNATDVVEMQLTDPDGVEVDYERVDAYEHGVYLHLGGYHETPKAGTYELVATGGYLEHQIFSKGFTFNGSGLHITRFVSIWEKSFARGYTSTSLWFGLENSGDITAYVDHYEIKIGNKTIQEYVGGAAWEPGMGMAKDYGYELTKEDDGPKMIFLESKGPHSVKITVYGSDTSIIDEREFSPITIGSSPSAWVEKETETPAFEFAFLIIAIASIILFKRRNKRNQ